MKTTATENMKTQKHNPGRGFTLVELMVSMAVGLVILAAMASLFKTGMNSAMMVSQRADTQENMRAGLDLLAKDVSMAGAGLPNGGIQLPTGGATLSKYGCDQTGTCHVPNGTYPNNGASPNYMYYIIPGYLDGVENNAVITAAPAPAVNDSVTVVYCDLSTSFNLSNYNVAFTSTAGTAVNVTPPTGSGLPAINSNGGINVGDLIYISGGGLYGVGEATNVTGTSITFANSDPLNINQSGATSGNLKAVATAAAGANVTAYRLFVVTYYLSVPPAGQTVRLMRQVNGLLPVPVADDIINLQFAYDVYNTTTDALDANEANPIGVGESPNNIQKVNMVVMGQSIINDGKNSQNMYLATDVSARNMAFRNVY
jgi:prepilin-type N-terminal cleavage/methylation domain-containing protein